MFTITYKRITSIWKTPVVETIGGYNRNPRHVPGFEIKDWIKENNELLADDIIQIISYEEE